MEEESHQLLKIESSQICIICDKDEKKPQLGTGFVFLRPNWVVTAAHVVLDDFKAPRDKLYAEFPDNRKLELPVKVLAVHKENDIALLEIIGDTTPGSKPLFPGYVELSVSKGLISLGYTPSKGRTITASLAKTYDKKIREREADETILEFESNQVEGGSSGGPIFGDGGAVLGILINVFTTEKEPDKTFARATSILNLMNGIVIDYNPEILISIK
ncbi:S1 family peptidase [Marivirga sp.]|uniref:S1 family peptidase n=1 Tax=Marivirga sp. TaxID=2018662 RepID=UPI003DA72D81